MKILILILLLTGVSFAVDVKEATEKMKVVDNDTYNEIKKLTENMKLADNATYSEISDIVDKMRSEAKSSLSTHVPENKKSGNELLIIFISSSIPYDVLHLYLKEAPENSYFVLRGTVGKDPGKLMPTIQYVTRLLCGTDKPKPETICLNRRIDINPELFMKFNISEVPAFIMSEKELSEILNSGRGKYKKFTGAAPINYVIEKFKE